MLCLCSRVVVSTKQGNAVLRQATCGGGRAELQVRAALMSCTVLLLATHLGGCGRLGYEILEVQPDASTQGGAGGEGGASSPAQL
jgi:hypothetical protein